MAIALASAPFALNGLYGMTGASGFETTSGFVGCAIAEVALYGDLGEQVEPVESEAGLRKQL